MSISIKKEAVNSIDDQQQRAIIKFLFVQGHSAAEAHRILVKDLAGCAYSKATVERWFKRFNGRDFDIAEHRGGDHHSVDQRQERINAIEDAFRQSRAWSLRSLSANTGIPQTTCREIVVNTLKMVKVNAKWVPHELDPGQMEARVLYSRINRIDYNQQKSRLQHTYAIDETWISLRRPPEKDQLKTWKKKGEPPPTAVAPSRYEPKYMMILAMDINGIFYFEILPQGQTVNAQRYLMFLENLIERIGCRRRHQVWLLDDNAKAHRSAQVDQWLQSKNIKRWAHPPYSPDLSPCDYGCFHQLKRAVGGKAYADIGSLTAAIEKEKEEGNRSGRYNAVSALPERWKRCIDKAGDYL